MGKNKRGGGANDIYSEHLGIFGYQQIGSNPAMQREAAIERMYQRVLTELAANRFKWTGLPESVDPRFLEMCLFYNALAVFYWDQDYDKYLTVRGSGMSYVNMLDNPTAFTVIGPGQHIAGTEEDVTGFQSKILSAYDPSRHGNKDESVKRKKAVPIWANYFRHPDLDIVRVYSSRLAELDRTIEINSKNARRSKVIKASPNTQLSVVNFAREFDQGSELLQVTGPMVDGDFIEALDLGIQPDTLEKLHILRTRQWNECMGLLGIDNANQDKKERLVADEVGANDAQTDSMRFVALNARRQACEIINDVFPELNIWVDYNTEIERKAEQAAEETDPETMTEGGDE